LVYRGVCCRLNDCKGPSSCGCKTSPIHQPSTSVLDSRYEVFALICCVWFSPNVLLCITTKHLHFGLICPKDIVPKVLLLVRMQLCKPKLCCYVLFREKMLSPGNLSCKKCFSKIIAGVFCPWQCVNTYLNASNQQPAKTSAFIEVLTPDCDLPF